MELHSVTAIARFISVGGRRVARITRFETDHSYSDPPVVENYREIWATFAESHPDKLTESGSFENTLREIGTPQQIAGAAAASPQQFAEMVSTAFDLGRIIAVASMGRIAMGDMFQDPVRYTKLEVIDDTLRFFSWRGRAIFGEPSEPSGIYRNVFSLTNFAMTLHELEAPYPKDDSEQAGARQPTTAPDSKSEGSEKPNPESEGRSQ